MNIPLFFSISGLINGLSSIVLGLMVFGMKRREKTNRLFAFLCFFISFYSFAFALWPFSPNKDVALLLFQFMSIGFVFIPVVMLHFVISVLGLGQRMRKIISSLYFVGIFFLLFSVSRFFVFDITPGYKELFLPRIGVLYYFFIFFALALFLYIFHLLEKYLKESRGIKKIRIKFLIYSTIFAFIAFLFNFFYYVGLNIPPYGIISWSVFVIFTTYAVASERLVDIRFVFRESTVFVLSLAVALLFGLLVKFLANWYLPFSALADDFLVIVFVVAIWPGIKGYFYKQANRYFFSSLYDGEALIVEISEKIRTILDPYKIYKAIFDLLINRVRAQSMGMLLYNEKKKEYTVQYQRNFGVKEGVKFAGNSFLHSHYVTKNDLIIIDEVKDNEKCKKIAQTMLAFGVEVLVPLNTTDKTIGLIAMGAKESGDVYNDADFRVLRVVGSITAKAIENAHLYKDIKEKNIHLEELLKMKSDFLRVVNHQLNTPLSIIRHALSAVKDETIPPKESLEIANIGLERISSTLRDFWYAYELAGKRMKMKLVKTDVLKVIDQIIGDKKRREMLKEKRMKVKLNKAKFKIPFVLSDYKRLSYALAQLIDNAIFYSENGREVKISFHKSKIDKTTGLEILISDTGVGIEKQDVKGLFDRFSRGHEASLIHPDGSGLGLYIAKNIIEDNNGRLYLKSTEVKKGSSFAAILPISSSQRNVHVYPKDN